MYNKPLPQDKALNIAVAVGTTFVVMVCVYKMVFFLFFLFLFFISVHLFSLTVYRCDGDSVLSAPPQPREVQTSGQAERRVLRIGSGHCDVPRHHTGAHTRDSPGEYRCVCECVCVCEFVLSMYVCMHVCMYVCM